MPRMATLATQDVAKDRNNKPADSGDMAASAGTRYEKGDAGRAVINAKSVAQPPPGPPTVPTLLTAFATHHPT